MEICEFGNVGDVSTFSDLFAFYTLFGYVGSSGRSVAPHLHYEITKDGKKIDPINFYHGNLSPLEYENLINQASQENQSLD